MNEKAENAKGKHREERYVNGKAEDEKNKHRKEKNVGEKVENVRSEHRKERYVNGRAEDPRSKHRKGKDMNEKSEDTKSKYRQKKNVNEEAEEPRSRHRNEKNVDGRAENAKGEHRQERKVSEKAEYARSKYQERKVNGKAEEPRSRHRNEENVDGRAENAKGEHRQERKVSEKAEHARSKRQERKVNEKAENVKSEHRNERKVNGKAEYAKSEHRNERKVNEKAEDVKSRHRERYSAGKTAGLSGSKQSMINRPACIYMKKCGGCRIEQTGYEVQLQEKQKAVEKLIGKYCRVEKIIGMENPYHYRNKVHAVFDHDKKGNPVSGIYEEGTHRVIPVDSCMIDDQKADEIIVSIRGLLKSFKIKTYDEDTQYGLLRHVLIRKGFTSGEIMVVLVVASPIFPSKNNFVKALRELHPEISTIILNVNDKRTSMVLGEKQHVIYGKGYIEDSLCGKVFRISPKSFYQINPVQTEVLYSKAIELARPTGAETVIDAYCGIGTIGLIASDYAKKVIGVELNKDAVRDAIINAKRNDVTNIEFYNNDASEFMAGMAAQKATADVVFLDPPRAGSDEKFLNALVRLKPERVVYISCNPVTLERDLAYLTRKGYRAVTAVPVDMFAWTGHVECVIMMTNSGSKGK